MSGGGPLGGRWKVNPGFQPCTRLEGNWPHCRSVTPEIDYQLPPLPLPSGQLLNPRTDAQENLAQILSSTWLVTMCWRESFLVLCWGHTCHSLKFSIFPGSWRWASVGAGVGSTEQPIPSDHPLAACQVPGPHGYVPDNGETCSPRPTHDLAHNFPRSGLLPPREVEADYNSSHLLL